MWEIVEKLILALFILMIFIYHIFESRAIQKAQQRPPQVGREALVGRVARVVELISEHESERKLRVFLDGTNWNAIARGGTRAFIKVGDKVEVTGVEDLKLIVM